MMIENLILLLSNTFEIEIEGDYVILREEIEDYFKRVEKQPEKINYGVYNVYLELQKLNKTTISVNEFYKCLLIGVSNYLKKHKIDTKEDITDFLDNIICEIII